MFVGLQLYKQNSLKTFKYHKLAPKFYGPFQLQKWSRQVGYSLDIPNKGKIHDEFHVPCLKKKLGSTTHIQTKFPMLDNKGKIVLQQKCISEIKTTTLHSIWVKEYLIKWTSLPNDEATGENEYFCSWHPSVPILCGWIYLERDYLL